MLLHLFIHLGRGQEPERGLRQDFALLSGHHCPLQVGSAQAAGAEAWGFGPSCPCYFVFSPLTSLKPCPKLGGKAPQRAGASGACGCSQLALATVGGPSCQGCAACEGAAMCFLVLFRCPQMSRWRVKCEMFFRDQHREKKRMNAVLLRGRRWTTTQVLQILGQPGWRGELWHHCWLLSVPNWVKRAGLYTPALLSHSKPAVQAQVWTQGKDSVAEEDHEGNSGRNMKNDCWPLLLSEGWKGSLSLMLILHGSRLSLPQLL